MKTLMLYACLLCPLPLYAAEAPETTPDEPRLYDHYVALKRMQERLASRPLDEQAKLQPQMQRAQGRACEQLRKDRQERIRREDYRQQGGDEFLVFTLELEQWCQTGR